MLKIFFDTWHGKGFEQYVNSMDIKIIQSTKPHRLRPHQRSGMDFCSYISIHEAARLRQGIPGLLHHGYDFNPRSRKASTLMPFMPLTVHQISIHEAARLRRHPPVLGISKLWFQSTKPQGFDTAGRHWFALLRRFQSTKPQGFDSKNIQKKISFHKTIYTHIIISPLTITTF